MKQRSLLASMAALGMAVAVAMMAGCAGPGGGSANAQGGGLAQMEPIVLTVSDTNAPTNANGLALQKFMDYVREETGGKVDFDVYWNGALHPGTETLSAIETGLTDLAFTTSSVDVDKVPGANWVAQTGPVMGDGFPHAQMEGVPALTAAYEADAGLQQEYANLGAKPLFYWSSTPFDMLCKDPIHTLEEAKGALVRTPGPPWNAEVEALGMTNVYLQASEMYEGLQRGVIDCAVLLPSSYMTTGVWEIAKNYIPVSFARTQGPTYLMNLEVWESLPLEVQQIIHDGKAAFLTEFMKNQIERYSVWAAEAEKMDLQFLDPTELQAAVSQHQDSVVADLPSSAPDAVADPDAFLANLETNRAQWAKIVENELGIEPVERTPESLLASYQQAADLPWAQYEEKLRTFLQQYRP